MLNAVRPALERALGPVGRALARTPITPNALTVTGTLGVSAGALALFPLGELFAGTMARWFFTFAAMLDGILAVQSAVTFGQRVLAAQRAIMAGEGGGS